MNIVNNNKEVSITLKEITDLIDVRHDRAMQKVEELTKESSFGTVSKIDIVYNDKNQTIPTYKLNKKQAIAIGAKLNDSLLMKIIDKLEELESKNNKPLTLPEQIQLIAQGYEKNNERLQIAEEKLGLVEQKVDNEILLTSAQKHHLRNLVSKKVYELKETHNFNDSFVRTGFQRVWKILKKHFIISSYMEIPKVKFEEAVKIVNGVEIGDLI